MNKQQLKTIIMDFLSDNTIVEYHDNVHGLDRSRLAFDAVIYSDEKANLVDKLAEELTVAIGEHKSTDYDWISPAQKFNIRTRDE